jgi:ATP-dependent Clp protease adapter protein ClpS
MYAAEVEAFVLLLSSFAASGVLWTWQNRARLREERLRQKQLATMLDEDMQIALHLAKHAAISRNQPLGPLHVLYAVTQDEKVAAAIAKLGGDPAALETLITAKLDEELHDLDPRDGNRLLGTALGVAHGHARPMTCVDALVMIQRTPTGELLAQPPLSADALVFELVHGDIPPTTLPRETHVHVVLRNDDYTTMQLVEHVLQTVFDLDPKTAHEQMRAVHEGGRAVVGRFGVEDARERIAKAREIAKSNHAPLWLGVEAC